MGANHVRAMGLTLASPDDICNCCEPQKNQAPKPSAFSRELDFHSRDWHPPTNTHKELRAKPKAQSPHLKKEVGSEVGSFIVDGFTLPEAARKVAPEKQPNRSLFQRKWTPHCSSEDTQKTRVILATPAAPVSASVSSSDESTEFTTCDSDSDYTTESPQRSPQRLPCTPRGSDVAIDLKNEDWTTLGQEVGSVLDYIRVENSKSAMMLEYAYWSQGTNCW